MSLVPSSDGGASPARSNPVPGSRVFSPQEIAVIRSLVAPKANAEELKLFLLRCKATGLDPIARQIYAIHRYDKREDREVMTIQVSIDGERLIAERTGLYEGRLGPFFCGPDGEWRTSTLPDGTVVPAPWLDEEPPRAALVGVRKRGNRDVLWSTALWKEYAQTFKDGNPSGLWGKMPAVMLGKCAESAALRAAFPAQLSGLYAEEEMPPPSPEATSRSGPAPVGAAVPSEPAYSADVVDVPATALEDVASEEGYFDVEGEEPVGYGQADPDSDAPASPPPPGVDPQTGEKTSPARTARILDPDNRLAMRTTQLLPEAKDDDWRHDFYEAVTGKRSGKEMTSPERDRVVEWAERIKAGEYVVVGYRPDGKLDVRQKPKRGKDVPAPEPVGTGGYPIPDDEEPF